MYIYRNQRNQKKYFCFEFMHVYNSLKNKKNYKIKKAEVISPG